MNDQYPQHKITIDSILKVSKQTRAIAMHSECQLLHDSIFSVDIFVTRRISRSLLSGAV